jgi:4-carboxymuconolactone decarboxylase
MARVADLAPEEMSEAQKVLHQEIAAKRHGTVRGPFAIWMRHPALGDRANRLGNVLRVEGKIEKRLFELMVLIVARTYSAQYEWFAHAHQALSDGVSNDVVEAIRHGKKPVYTKADEALVDELTRATLAGGVIDQALYQRGLDHFGLDQMIELAASIGFYTMVAMTLNVFDAPVPDGSRPLPDL